MSIVLILLVHVQIMLVTGEEDVGLSRTNYFEARDRA